MLKRSALALGLWGIAWTGSFAGTLTGKISGIKTKDQDVVVWIEGAPKEETKSRNPTISQKNIQFDPPITVITAGDTVNMPNDDDLAHNVFSYSSAKKFNLGIYSKGDSKSVTFDKPGVVEIMCSIHRNMHATIIVVPNSYYDLTSIGKNYHIQLPAGSYTAKAWRAGFPEFSKKVKIPKDGDVAMDIEFKKKTALGE